MVSQVAAGEWGATYRLHLLRKAHGSRKAVPCLAALRTITVTIASHTGPHQCPVHVIWPSKMQSQMNGNVLPCWKIAMTASTSAPSPGFRSSVDGHQDVTLELAQRNGVDTHLVWPSSEMLGVASLRNRYLRWYHPHTLRRPTHLLTQFEAYQCCELFM